MDIRFRKNDPSKRHCDIYHVTPVTPNGALIDVCAGRNVLVSMARPDQLIHALNLGGKVLGDHGRFSTWMAAMRAGLEWCDDDVPRHVYYEWLEPWIWRDGATAIMPDIPGAPSQLNDSELIDWPFPVDKGLPVWHMDGPIARLGRLCEKYPRVCLGWIGDPKKEPVGCDAYHYRMDEVASLFGNTWPETHMLRGIAVSGDYPFQRCGRQHARAKRAPARLAGRANRHARRARDQRGLAGAAQRSLAGTPALRRSTGKEAA